MAYQQLTDSILKFRPLFFNFALLVNAIVFLVPYTNKLIINVVLVDNIDFQCVGRDYIDSSIYHLHSVFYTEVMVKLKRVLGVKQGRINSQAL
jgi:hypothetical protein